MKTLMVTWFACCVAACAADDRPTAEDPSAEHAAAAIETSATNDAVQVPWQLRMAPTNAQDVPASSLEALDPVPPGGTQAQNCVFIQFCDRPPAGPGNDGTICKVRPSCFNQCFNQAIIDECNADVRAVCGTATLPKVIECF